MLLAGCGLWACGGRSGSPPPDEATAAGAAGPQTSKPAGVGNPLDVYIEQAGAYLTSTQAEDGSWAYFHSQTPEFEKPERHANLFGTLITLMNLTHTRFETSPAFKRGAEYVQGRMLEGFAWALYQPGELGEVSWFEPDADDTAVALTLLAGRLALKPGELKKVRALFDRYRTADGLYRTYFDGFHGGKGFVPDRNVPSIGVNLNVLGFFGKYGLHRSGLMQGLRSALQGERYWEKTPFYRSLPVLAYLAGNTVEHGAPEAGELLRRILADFAAGPGADPDFAGRLGTVELAAYVKARAQACLLDQAPCRELDGSVFQLARRRKMDGSWNAAAFYEYDVNPSALEAFLERRDFVTRKRSGVAYDVERALAAPGTLHYYDGSPAETTSFALKALVFYRELLNRRHTFRSQPQKTPGARPATPAVQ